MIYNPVNINKVLNFYVTSFGKNFYPENHTHSSTNTDYIHFDTKISYPEPTPYTGETFQRILNFCE